MTPRIGLCPGDPAGIGAELVAKLLADPRQAQAAILIVGDPDHMVRGQRIAGTDVALRVVEQEAEIDLQPGRPTLLVRRLQGAVDYPLGKAQAEGGRYCLDCLGTLSDLERADRLDAFCFAPLNKSAMKLGGIGHADEMHWFAERLGYRGHVAELNVLDGLWTSRVTSHVALRDVADLITVDRVIDAIDLISGTLKRAGRPNPKIAVAGLNPHAGDNGAFGREEIDVLAPAIEKARAAGHDVSGPYSPDTMFLTARKLGQDAIVTMYHDQGQIALKALGFDRGISVMGGLPSRIATPAHGTAYDIAGKGVADTGAFFAAFDLAQEMGTAARRRAAA